MTLRAIFLPALLLAAPAALAQDLLPSKNAGPYVPSPESVVSDMLKVAQVGPNDFIIDLGSGDGRIVLTAAKVFGARGFGVEIKDELVQKANQAAKAQGIADRVRFVKQDLFKTDISQATVLTMYLLPDTVNLLKDKLLNELKPGTRVISHDYPLTGSPRWTGSRPRPRRSSGTPRRTRRGRACWRRRTTCGATRARWTSGWAGFRKPVTSSRCGSG
jgi:protein-L-isoaspartate O-methyltransferase